MMYRAQRVHYQIGLTLYILHIQKTEFHILPAIYIYIYIYMCVCVCVCVCVCNVERMLS
jgi:hypothetical protein